MEALTRLVSESLARHGFDRPLDYRRLHWSRWFRCESPHSLLAVPSKPGVFALAEEIMDLAADKTHVGTAALGCPTLGKDLESNVEERRFSAQTRTAASAAGESRRMLAVAQFFDADDMAFTLDRMLTRANPMRARLSSGHYFVRYVVIEDLSQRLSITTALNQWIANSSEKASGIGAHFASSLELTGAHVGTAALGCPAERSSAPAAPPHLDSGAATNIHCPSPLPSGF